jgi:di- and tripeptidase
MRTPRLEEDDPKDAKGGQDLEIHRQHIKQYAHFGYVYCMLLVRIHAQEQYQEVLISGGGDGAIKIWSLDMSNSGAIAELYALEDSREEGESVLSLAIDGSILFAGRLAGEVNVWDLETRQLVRSLRCWTDDVLALTVGGGYLFCAGMTGTVEVSRPSTKFILCIDLSQKFNAQCERVARFQAHNGRILASAFSSHLNRPIYLTGGNDATISIWDVKDCIQAKSSILKTSNGQ